MIIVFLGPIFSVILPLMYKVGMQRKFAPATMDPATITEIVNSLVRKRLKYGITKYPIPDIRRYNAKIYISLFKPL